MNGESAFSPGDKAESITKCIPPSGLIRRTKSFRSESAAVRATSKMRLAFSKNESTLGHIGSCPWV